MFDAVSRDSITWSVRICRDSYSIRRMLYTIDACEIVNNMKQDVRSRLFSLHIFIKFYAYYVTVIFTLVDLGLSHLSWEDIVRDGLELAGWTDNLDYGARHWQNLLTTKISFAFVYKFLSYLVRTQTQRRHIGDNHCLMSSKYTHRVQIRQKYGWGSG